MRGQYDETFYSLLPTSYLQMSTWVDVTNKSLSSIASLCCNIALWLAFSSYVTSFHQSDCFISAWRRHFVSISEYWLRWHQSVLEFIFKKTFKSFNVCACKLRQKGFHSFGPWLWFFLLGELIFSSQRQLSNGRRRSMLLMLMLPIISIAHLNLFLSFLFTLSLSLDLFSSLSPILSILFLCLFHFVVYLSTSTFEHLFYYFLKRNFVFIVLCR